MNELELDTKAKTKAFFEQLAKETAEVQPIDLSTASTTDLLTDVPPVCLVCEAEPCVCEKKPSGVASLKRELPPVPTHGKTKVRARTEIKGPVTQMNKPAPVENKKPAEEESDELRTPQEFLQSLPGGPSEADLEKLKQTVGDIYVLPFSDTEAYIWRPLKRFEYKQVVQSIAQTRQAHLEKGSNPPDLEQAMEDMVVQRCVVWPKVTADHLQFGNAGTIPTLYEAIMRASHFVPPAVALENVRKL